MVFLGITFRDKFWKAAKTTTKRAFLLHLEDISKLKQEAYDYLAAIPPQHRSRRAFPTTSKSKMLLNNCCETFNAVIKEARDKLILSLLEWIRRYVMTRFCEKREEGMKYDKVNMPYVYKHFTWAEEESRYCICLVAVVNLWEVQYKSERHVLNIATKECSCKFWQLTGISCVHAYACILK